MIRKLINLQQVLANNTYYEMLFFPHTVKEWNSLPTTLLAADSLKAIKAGVTILDYIHHYVLAFLNHLLKCLPTKFLPQ